MLRLGVVAYLNMQPLVHGLLADEAGSGRQTRLGELELRQGPPSALARWLEAGEIDVGMVPVAAMFRHPEWRVMAAPAGAHARASMIGSRGPVLSVLLIGGGAVSGWRRLRLDGQSMTSNALAQIYLRQGLGLELEIEPADASAHGYLPPQPEAGTAQVLIGSRALEWVAQFGSDKNGSWTCLDLGERWTAWTGLPSVNALWAVRPGVELGEWPARLEALKCTNMARIPAIVNDWGRLEAEGLTAQTAAAYLTRHLDYDFDDAAQAGLLRFHELGADQGLFPPGWELRFHNSAAKA
jgi:chorismate dehydratase